MDADRLGDLATDRHRRVERGHRVLEDHADVVAADLADLLLADRHEVAAVQSDLAAGDEPAPRQQAHDRHRGHRLAAAGLADDAHGLSRLDVEAEAVDGVDGAAAQADPGLEIVDLEQSRHRRHRSCRRTSNASWSASPMKLKATTVITMIDQRRIHLPPVTVLEIGGAVREHRSPSRCGRRQAEAEILQDGQRQDRVGDLEGDRHDDRADRVGDDVTEDDAARAAAHHPYRLHVLTRSEAERLPADQARRDQP